MDSKLFQTDYVIYDKSYNNVVRWESNKKIVIYGDFQEASDDCNCTGNQIAIPCTELSSELKQELINQLS